MWRFENEMFLFWLPMVTLFYHYYFFNSFLLHLLSVLDYLRLMVRVYLKEILIFWFLGLKICLFMFTLCLTWTSKLDIMIGLSCTILSSLHLEFLPVETSCNTLAILNNSFVSF